VSWREKARGGDDSLCGVNARVDAAGPFRGGEDVVGVNRPEDSLFCLSVEDDLKWVGVPCRLSTAACWGGSG